MLDVHHINNEGVCLMAKIKSNKTIEDLFSDLSEPHKKFFEIVDNLDKYKFEDWTAMHYLAYICLKYKEKFGINFILPVGQPVSKTIDYKFTTNIQTMITTQYKKKHIKEYIDWFFENYTSSKPFKSVGALSRVECISKFL